MAENKLSSQLSIDTTDFKTQLSSINREIRVLESEFKKNTSGMQDWSKTSEGLEANIQSLSGKIEAQKRLVSAIQKEYEKSAAEKGKDARQTQELEIKLNKATATLNQWSADLKESEDALEKVGEESQDTGKKVEDLGDKQEKAAKKSEGFGKALNGLKGITAGVGKAITAVAVAASLAVTGMAGMVMKASDAASELVDLSNKTGVSVQQLQEMQYVGDQLGVSLDTMGGSYSRLIRAMNNAREGTGAIAEGFATLGVSVVDSNGNLRNSNTVFQETLTALGKMENETEADAIALQLFGRSAMELNPLIRAGSDEINRMTDEAYKLGAIMPTDAVEGLEAFGDEVASLKASFQGNMGMLAAAVLPGFQTLTGTAKEYMGEFTGILRESGGDIGKAGPEIGTFLAKIFTDLAKGLPGMMNTGLAIIQSLLNAIIASLPAMLPGMISMLQALIGFIATAAPMLIQAAIPIVTQLVLGIVALLPQLMEAGMEILLSLVDGIGSQLPMLIKTAIEMVISLITGIAQALPDLMAMIATLIPEIIITLIESLPLLIDAAIQLILALIDGLVIALPILIEYTPKIITAIFDALVTALPKIGEAAAKIINKLIDGIIKMIPELLKGVYELGKAIISGISDYYDAIRETGVNLVTGLWDGFVSRLEWIKDKVKGFFKSVVDTSNEAVQVQSPSRVFAGIGQYMAEGLGLGFENEMESVKRSINGAMSGFGADVTVSGSGNAGFHGNTVVNLGGITVYAKTKEDAREIASATEMGVLQAMRAAGMA